MRDSADILWMKSRCLSRLLEMKAILMILWFHLFHVIKRGKKTCSKSYSQSVIRMRKGSNCVIFQPSDPSVIQDLNIVCASRDFSLNLTLSTAPSA